MSFRATWITVVGLSPVALYFVALTQPKLEFVGELFDLECHGVGEAVICPENQVVFGVGLYSAIVVTCVLFIAAMALVVAVTHRSDRAGLTIDLYIVTIIAAGMGAAIHGAILLGSFTSDHVGPYTATGFTHLLASVLLVAGLAKSSKPLSIAACLLGVVSVAAPISSPFTSAIEAGAATWFAVLLLAMVIPSRRDPASATLET